MGTMSKKSSPSSPNANDRPSHPNLKVLAGSTSLHRSASYDLKAADYVTGPPPAPNVPPPSKTLVLATGRVSLVMADPQRTLVYGKNDPFRSWPISANELEEVAMGSETNV